MSQDSGLPNETAAGGTPDDVPTWRDAWDDPNVKMALQRRDSAHIYLMQCGSCGCYSYYNEGSHFSCQWCHWSVDGEDLDAMLENGEITRICRSTGRMARE
jgi:hypothetical protein